MNIFAYACVGQYAEIEVEAIAPGIYVPFSIASGENDDQMIFFIRGVGHWTMSLYTLAEQAMATRYVIVKRRFESEDRD